MCTCSPLAASMAAIAKGQLREAGMWSPRYVGRRLWQAVNWLSGLALVPRGFAPLRSETCLLRSQCRPKKEEVCVG